MTVTHKPFKILSGHGFCIKWYCDLWHSDLKCIGVIYLPWPILLPSKMTVTHKLFKILSGHGFCMKCFCDLDLWPSDFSIYRGHLLTMSNLPTKYHGCHSEIISVTYIKKTILFLFVKTCQGQNCNVVTHRLHYFYDNKCFPKNWRAVNQQL